ncbi:hypothetical protein FV219_00380 [Methylobacterium sp. WL122]|nr:hypothetical protein FV219_00380 [Methylobacterium sp. WL122]
MSLVNGMSLTLVASRVPLIPCWRVPETDEELTHIELSSNETHLPGVFQVQRGVAGPRTQLDLNDLANLYTFNCFDDPSAGVILEPSSGVSNFVDVCEDNPRNHRAAPRLGRHCVEQDHRFRREGSTREADIGPQRHAHHDHD